MLRHYLLSNRLAVACVAVLVWVFGGAAITQAAVLEATSEVEEVAVGQSVVVAVWLNAQDQPVNTIAGELRFPADLLTVTGISDGNSVVSFWVDRPTASGGKVSFSGAIPGGYAGRSGRVFSVTLSARATGLVQLQFAQLQALLNDGLGTAAKITGEGLRLAVAPPSAFIQEPPQTATTTDRLPPEPFELQVGKAPETFGDVWFVVFATQDKESGIDRYEIQEGRGGRVDERVWKLATSPYVLRDQSLRSTIFVRAIDRAGNIRLAVAGPTGDAGYTKFLFWGIIAVCGILLGGMFLLVVGRRKNPHRNDPAASM